jgi:hypothetical protein
MNAVPLDQLNFEVFAKLVKTRFHVWMDAQNTLDLELSEITPPRVVSTAGAKHLAYENFALVFLGPADRLLPQQMFWFESAAIGRFELFIVPISRDQNGTRYQATFNRLVKSG